MPEKTVRLLQAIAGGKHGGAEEFFVRLACAFERVGIEQKILVRAGCPWIKRISEVGIEVVPLRFGGSLDLFSRSRAKKEIENFHPTHLLTWMNRATKICSNINTIEDYTHIARLGGYYKLKYYGACDHLIGNTEKIVSYLSDNGWPDQKVHYLSNFADRNLAKPTPRNNFSTPDGNPLILALGRCHENKGFDILLRALSLMPDVWLWVAGDGPLRESLERQADSLSLSNRVRFLGWREDVKPLLAAADIFVCPSRLEPLGNVVIEAWASKIPIVAAAADGPVQLITPGENGLIVPLEDPMALASSIQTLIKNPELVNRLVGSGYNTFTKHYTEELIVASYLSLFKRTFAA